MGHLGIVEGQRDTKREMRGYSAQNIYDGTEKDSATDEEEASMC